MSMFINNDDCTGCGDCEPVCPTGSISNRNGVFVIDVSSCTECADDSGEPHCISVCPSDYCIQPLYD
ncbi:4Fe-4S binding protein [Candidatus Methylobacter oryzae]|uniref:4Fe-4S dicluster domain-containing protein n=1 Tax=Candidatus Methylobacter oryzae TaxID=2497749 RepID=A0ABY3C4K8_9GAMM|nr:4Fe-4S binding protein [Candidatus Methylobacter oryzae]TRW89622.1 4Fe-4S dicluster domain-containing protein [Candidatus Methylobacter oryzae]